MTRVFRVAKLRFVDRPPASAPWRKLHAVADAAVPAAEKAFMLAVRDFRAAIDMEEFANAIALRTDADMAIVLLPWAVLERSLEQRLLPILRSVRDGGAEVAAANLGSQLKKPLAIAKAKDPKKKPKDPKEPTISGEIRFDLRNPRAEQHIAQHGARLVQMVTDETRAAIRQVVLRGQEQGGVPVREQAKRIAAILRRDIGLNAPQARALVNFEAGLIANDTAPSKVRQLVAARREDMIGQRSRVIARQETLTGAKEGQQEVWRQARSERLIPSTVKRKWLTQRHVNANNPCPICEPMNGQIRGLEEPFVSPYNGASSMGEGMHVGCICAVVLEIPDL